MSSTPRHKRSVCIILRVILHTLINTLTLPERDQILQRMFFHQFRTF